MIGSGTGRRRQRPEDLAVDARYTLTHLKRSSDPPAGLDVVLLHFDDLLADLEGQMRGLATRLGIDVPESRWPELVDAASFVTMRRNATMTVPGASPSAVARPAGLLQQGHQRPVADAARRRRPRATRRGRASSPEPLLRWVHRSSFPT